MWVVNIEERKKKWLFFNFMKCSAKNGSSFFAAARRRRRDHHVRTTHIATVTITTRGKHVARRGCVVSPLSRVTSAVPRR